MPGDRWGASTEQELIVREDVGSPLTPVGREVTVAELRPTPPAGVRVLEIRGQLDGPCAQFGARFWDLVLSRASDLMQRLQDENQELIRIHYTDRYLRSPTVLRLLFESVRRLLELNSGKSPAGITVEIITTRLAHDGRAPPSSFEHDWDSESTRRDVADNLLRSLGVAVRFLRAKPAEVPHARSLRLEWKDGSSFICALDQGFGAWRDRGSTPFPFRQGLQQQLSRLATAAFPVEARSQFGVPAYIHPIEKPRG